MLVSDGADCWRKSSIQSTMNIAAAPATNKNMERIMSGKNQVYLVFARKVLMIDAIAAL